VFYLAIASTLVPYTTVMVLARAMTLSRRTKLLTTIGVGAFVSAVGFAVARAIGMVPGDPLAILYGFLAGQAVAWALSGLVPFARQYAMGAAITLFVLLSVPSSAGSIPDQMLPAFFRWLHLVMPMGNLIDATRSIFYFDGTGLLRPTLVLCAWVASGATLIGASALLQRNRHSQATHRVSTE
jgi:uncharacterized phage infection (PIP) family protein YhgE